MAAVQHFPHPGAETGKMKTSLNMSQKVDEDWGLESGIMERSGAV